MLSGSSNVLNSDLCGERDKGFTANYGFYTYDESPLQHEMRKENVAKWKISPGQQETATHERLGKMKKKKKGGGGRTQELGKTLFL